MRKLLKHESGITFEIVEKPWFGPKQRGRTMLLDSPRYGREIGHVEFVDFLSSTFPNLVRNIQHIRFHKCEFDDKGKAPWALRYAVISTEPDYETRQALHEQGEGITNATGWYPLITGKRVRLYRSADPAWLVHGKRMSYRLADQKFGAFRSITNINTHEGGCSLFLQFEQRSVLLDFGFSFSAPLTGDRLSFGVLTHTHRDHAGGARDVLRADIPILMSESVFLQMAAFQRWRHYEMVRIAQTRPPCSIGSMEDGTRFDFLPGAHSPGALMVRVTGSDGTEVLYPGDYCLSNRYYSEEPSALCRLFGAGSGAKFLLVDGTFLGHGPKATEGEEESSSAALLEAHDRGRPIVFCAENLDYLYAVYIWYFKAFYSGPKQKLSRRLYVQDSLIRLVETSFDAFIHRRHEEFDPFLNAVVGTSMSNYLESVRLYPFSGENWPDRVDGPNDVFCSADLLEEACSRFSCQPLVFLIGRNRKGVPQSVAQDSFFPLDGPDFAFHSRPKDVAAILRCAVDSGIRPLVFHNFPGRIKKALRVEGISDHDYDILWDRPVRLHS